MFLENAEFKAQSLLDGLGNEPIVKTSQYMENDSWVRAVKISELMHSGAVSALLALRSVIRVSIQYIVMF